MQVSAVPNRANSQRDVILSRSELTKRAIAAPQVRAPPRPLRIMARSSTTILRLRRFWRILSWSGVSYGLAESFWSGCSANNRLTVLRWSETRARRVLNILISVPMPESMKTGVRAIWIIWAALSILSISLKKGSVMIMWTGYRYCVRARAELSFVG